MEHFVSFIGGIAIFILGMDFAKEGLTSAAGDRLRSTIAKTTSNRFTSLASGMVVTTLLQSSSATTVILVSLASTGLISLARSIGVILGADIGTTVTVQLLAFPVKDFGLLMVAGGYAVRLMVKRGVLRGVAEGVMGFGMLFFGMKLMGEGAVPLRDAETFRQVIEASPLLGVVVSAVLTAIIQSSAATIGIAISLAQADSISVTAAIALVLGANIGTSATAVLASTVAKPEGKRVAVAHVATKIIAVIVFLPFIDLLRVGAEWMGGDAPRQIANAHMLFNVATALLFLPFVHHLGRLIERMFPFKPKREPFGAAYLDAGAISQPSIAMANVTREIFRMAEVVERMLARSLEALAESSEEAIDRMERDDTKVDRLDKEIKFYLAKVPKRLMGDRLAKEFYFLFSLTNDIEEAGDIVSKNLVHLARKKRKLNCQFSDEGLREITDYHGAVTANFKLAMSAFATRDPDIAKKVIDEKRRLREVLDDMEQRHVDRLNQGVVATYDTASLHMNVLGHLSRVNSIISSVAYRIKESKDD
ncbi:MAG: Na/Pi cotransporter family protein [Deltaproteobacteria bacterium]|nr:Na/Pi cotransporter family protein [Deltaproteobacteria bacterium]